MHVNFVGLFQKHLNNPCIFSFCLFISERSEHEKECDTAHHVVKLTHCQMG